MMKLIMTGKFKSYRPTFLFHFQVGAHVWVSILLRWSCISSSPICFINLRSRSQRIPHHCPSKEKLVLSIQQDRFLRRRYGVTNNGVVPYPAGYSHPIRVEEQGNYHGIVYHVYSGVPHPMVSMLFIP